MVKVAAPQLYI